jgi:hypothetical protein
MDVSVLSSGIENMLANAAKKFAPFASKALLLALEITKEIIQVYAPQPSRTRAKTFNTYVRGLGNFPKSAFVADNDAPGGFRTKKVPRASIRMTSQQMDKRWQMNVSDEGGGVITGELINTASYSGYVVGFKVGEVRQMDFHAESGWVSASDAITQAMPGIQKVSEDAVQDFVQSLG